MATHTCLIYPLPISARDSRLIRLSASMPLTRIFRGPFSRVREMELIFYSDATNTNVDKFAEFQARNSRSANRLLCCSQVKFAFLVCLKPESAHKYPMHDW